MAVDHMPTIGSSSIRRELSALRWIFQDNVQLAALPTVAKAAAGLSRLCQLVHLDRQSCSLLSSASRFANSGYADRVAANWDIFQNSFETLVSTGVTEESAARRTIILRHPGTAHNRAWKGILVITFTRTSSFYYRHIDFRRLANEYHVFLEPSWMGYCDPDILFWALSSAPVFVEASEIRDRQFLATLNRNLIAVDFGASDWVDERIFQPLPNVRKIYDVTYVANRGAYKRPHVFFRAVKKAVAKNSQFRAAFVCASWGGSRDTIRDLIEHYGLGDNLVLLESLSTEEVNTVLNQSKLCVLLSRKEGSNRSLFEAMFANTPALVLSENVGVNKSYFNAETGVVADEADLAEAIVSVSGRYFEFRPRQWAMQNISAHATRRKLISAIQKANPEEPIREPDVRLKVNRPEVCFYDDDTRSIHVAEARAVLRRYRVTSDR